MNTDYIELDLQCYNFSDKQHCQAELDKHSNNEILYENGIWKIASNDEIQWYFSLVMRKPSYSPYNWKDVGSIVKRTFAKEKLK